MFGLSLKAFGDVNTFDEVQTEGSLLDQDLVVSYAEDGRLVGVLTVGQNEEIEAELKELIARRAPLTAARAGCEFAIA